MIFSHNFYHKKNSSQEQILEDAYTAISQERSSGKVGYYTLPSESVELICEIDCFMQENPLFKTESIVDIAILGVGGSSLGTKAVDSLLKPVKSTIKNLHFFENTDPLNIATTLKKLTKEKTLFVVISKSGTTIETISIFKSVIEYYKLDIEGEDKDRIVIVTDKGSSLSQFADHYKMKQFEIPHNVGGRFSVLSAVGIVPLSLAGYDTKALLRGADLFSERFFSRKEEHLLEKGYFLVNNTATITTNVLFAYANELENLCKWYVQLWGESLGKINALGEAVGLTPLTLIGSVDQHSFLQLLMEGPKDKSVTFINIADFKNDIKIPTISLPYLEKTDFVFGKSFGELINLQCEATQESLALKGVVTDKITFEAIDEENIGTMIMYYELLTSLVGILLQVDVYNQPGVELGKTILCSKFDN